jgi:YfiH family protein
MAASRARRRRSTAPPAFGDGVHGWRFAERGATLLFLGRGTPRERDAPLPGVWLPAGVERARLAQVHGATVLAARAGRCGEGDALTGEAPGLALEIATADCVPVLLVGARRLGAVHAGWRGIAAGVVTAAVAAMGGDAPTSAWIGPSIGPCCYEVDEPVADAVAAAAPGAPVVARRSGRGRPVLDLVAAVEAQLADAGVARIESVDVCTRCRPEWLWSYRRDGAGAGRNMALIWRQESG